MTPEKRKDMRASCSGSFNPLHVGQIKAIPAFWKQSPECFSDTVSAKRFRRLAGGQCDNQT